MSELAILLLVVLTASAALGAAPIWVGAGGRAEPTHPPKSWRPAAWVTLALAALVSLCCAATLALTVLGSAGAVGCLAGVSGCITAAACARRLRWRLTALAGVVVATLLVTGLLSWFLMAGHGGLTGSVSLLRATLGGAGQLQSHRLELLVICWANGIWVGWFATFERAGVIACAVPMVLLISDLVNLPPALEAAPLWPVLGAVAFGLAMIGWTHQERQLARWSRLEIPFGEFRRGRGLLLVVAAAAALSVLALLIPPMNRDNISARFFRAGPPAALSQKSSRIAPISGYSKSVVPGGPIREVGSPVLTYRTTAAGGSVYLAGVALSDFVAGNWYQAVDGTRYLGPDQLLDPDESPSAGESNVASAREQVSLTVTYSGTGAEQVPDLLYPGSPLKTPSDPGTYVARGVPGGSFLTSVDGVVPVTGVQSVLPPSERITTVGTVSVANAKQLRTAGTDYPSWLNSYRGLPADTNFLDQSTLAHYAQAMSDGATNPYQIAVNIQNSLRAEETYTLQPPAAPSGTWPIIYFLQDSHQGYCQYFASSMGAMLRALGIPDRLVNGFGPGEERALPDGQRVVTEADAHTWVQVYFPAYGWVNFDPTPDGFYPPAGVAAATKSKTSSSPSALGEHHAGIRSAQPSGLQRVKAQRSPGFARTLPLVGLAVLLILLLAAAAAIAWIWRARSPGQIRRRLELPVRLALAGYAPARTLPELAEACAGMATGLRNRELREALLELAHEADQLAFARPQADQPTVAQFARWRQVRRAYPLIVWRAWRTRVVNRSRLAPPSAPRIEAGSW